MPEAKSPVCRATSQDSSLLFGFDDFGTADQTSASGGNETSLLTWGSGAGERRGVTDVLLVTTTVGMVNRVHGDTTHARPFLLLGQVLVEHITSLQERLVGSLATSDDADHSSAAAEHGLSGSGGKADSALGSVVGVTDDDGRGAGSAGEASAVTQLGLDIGDNGALGHGIDGKDVSNREGSYNYY